MVRWRPMVRWSRPRWVGCPSLWPLAPFGPPGGGSGRSRRGIAQGLAQTLLPLVRERRLEHAALGLRHLRQNLVARDALYQQEQRGRVRLDRAPELVDEVAGDAVVVELAGEGAARGANPGAERHPREGVEEQEP